MSQKPITYYPINFGALNLQVKIKLDFFALKKTPETRSLL